MFLLRLLPLLLIFFKVLGLSDDAARWKDLANSTRQKMRNEMWNETRGAFVLPSNTSASAPLQMSNLLALVGI